MPRPKGSPNKITAATRAFLKAWLEGTEDEALNCWRSIDDPGMRFRLWLQAAEFVHPKLGRQELSGADGEPIQVVVKTYGKGE